MEVGQIFELKYKIMRVLGSSKMSVVYLAQNISLGSSFAIKEVPKTLSNQIDLLAEPLLLTRLKHSALPKIFDIVENDDYLYIIEEFIEGRTLDSLLQEQKTVPEQIVVAWAKEICRLLSYLHSRKPYPIIYRDMKPSNLMVTPEGQIKLIDFGIAREYKEESGSDTTYMGTRGYAAPEQYGTAQTDARTDIYGLGVTLYHLVTGKGPNDPPFELKPVRELNRDLSHGIEHILRKSTQQDPETRYQSAEAMLHDLENILEFNSEYRRARALSRLPIAVFATLFLVSASLTVFGVRTMDTERLNRYTEAVAHGVGVLRSEGLGAGLTALNSAAGLIPDMPDAYREIAKAYLDEGLFEECVRYIRNDAFLEADITKTDPLMLYILGTAHFEMKDYPKAIDSFNSARGLDPYNTDYQRDLAVSYARDGKIQEAEALLHALKNADTKSDVVTYISGEILLRKGSIEEALSAFKECLASSQDASLNRRAVITTAQVYKDSERLDEEISFLAGNSVPPGLKNDPVIVEMTGDAYFSRAMVQGSSSPGYRQDLLNSAASFQLLLDSGLKRGYLYRNVGIIYHYLGDYAKSETVLKAMAEAYPEDYRVYYELALLYADREGQKPNASRNYMLTFRNYELAMKFSTKEVQESELLPLTRLIDELRSKGWS